MKRTLFAIFGCALLTTAMIAANPATPPQAGADKGTVYVGCLVPGASAGNYTLLNAVEKGSKDKAKSKVSFTVVPGSPKMNLEAQLTREVEIVGAVSDQGSGQATLTATKIKWRADFCG